MFEIPVDFTDFLLLLKEKTENYWSKAPESSHTDIEYKHWKYGAKWQGLTNTQIDSIENLFAIRFTTEHRAFLNVLHAIDRYENIEHIESEERQNYTWVEKRPYFYNWLTDHVAIKKYLLWPFDTILSDVLVSVNNVWLKSWGDRPGSPQERGAIFTQWYGHAPKLLPLTAHTFLVSDTNLEKRPVLSVWGSDTIISGWNLKAYLISEFAVELGLMEMKYDEEDKEYYPEFKDESLPVVQEYFQFKLIHNIPYWEEMILYSNSQFHKVHAANGPDAP